MKEVVVLTGASGHVQGIYQRLDNASEGLGDAFYGDFLKGCLRVSRSPEAFPRHDKRFRKLLLKKWQVAIFYSIEGLRIMVSAVMDVRQSPETIRRYLDSL
jgi:hypothetical protein